VVDPSGAPVEAEGRLTGQAADVHRTFATSREGRYTARILPFGRYTVEVTRDGFKPAARLIEILSENPLDITLTLGVATVETALVIRDSDTLLDPHRTGANQHIGRETIEDRRSSAPSRGALDLVNTQPGWLLEANGILHPRGSEYQVQYVIDGIPIFDNRSPAFAQSLGVEEFEAMNIRTANYPAEYGRKLGGVIEVSTDRDRQPGFHGSASLQAGSFGTVSSYASAQYGTDRFTFGLSGEGMVTDRYLDAPVEQNYTNRASGGGGAARFDIDSSKADRTRMYFPAVARLSLSRTSCSSSRRASGRTAPLSRPWDISATSTSSRRRCCQRPLDVARHSRRVVVEPEFDANSARPGSRLSRNIRRRRRFGHAWPSRMESRRRRHLRRHRRILWVSHHRIPR
jgi:hypothetical protein